MYPNLGQALGGLPIGSYGAFALFGVGVGIVAAIRLGRRRGLRRRDLVDLCLWVLIAALLGAKLLQMGVDLATGAEGASIGSSVGGGLALQGGLVAGIVVALLFARRRGLSRGDVLDTLAPSAALGLAWGRMGCFLAGACWGRAGGGALGVSAVPDSAAHDHHAIYGLLVDTTGPTYPLHPVQLYEAGVELVLVGVILVVLTPRRRWSGQLAIVYLVASAVSRLGTELFRGDPARGFVGEPIALPALNHALGVDGGSPTLLSLPQAGALIVVLLGVWVWVVMRSRRASADVRETDGAA